mmetsp:Transcript_28263/g.83678  ORF Transcript_28263/g.83678 Transcript_28263/m.83678 type:complete len:236 (+) Transcript_28263:2114-2821(+)
MRALPLHPAPRIHHPQRALCVPGRPHQGHRRRHGDRARVPQAWRRPDRWRRPHQRRRSRRSCSHRSSSRCSSCAQGQGRWRPVRRQPRSSGRQQRVTGTRRTRPPAKGPHSQGACCRLAGPSSVRNKSRPSWWRRRFQGRQAGRLFPRRFAVPLALSRRAGCSLLVTQHNAAGMASAAWLPKQCDCSASGPTQRAGRRQPPRQPRRASLQHAHAWRARCGLAPLGCPLTGMSGAA